MLKRQLFFLHLILRKMLSGELAVEEILTSFDLILFDCDGVIWQGGELLPKVQEALSKIELNKIKTKFITNTSTRSVEAMHNRMKSFGLASVNIADCFHSGVAVAHLIHTEYPQVKRVYMVGESGLRVELEKVGLVVIGGAEENDLRMTDDVFRSLDKEDPVDAIVVGYDMGFNFYKLARACNFFQKNNCLFFACNADLTDKIGSKYIPGNGAALAAIVASISQIPNIAFRAPLIVGKPNKIFANLVLQKSNLSDIPRERVLVIGDRMDTDIQLAKNCGFKSCLVLSGCATENDLIGLDESDLPDYLLTGLSQLVDYGNFSFEPFT